MSTKWFPAYIFGVVGILCEMVFNLKSVNMVLNLNVCVEWAGPPDHRTYEMRNHACNAKPFCIQIVCRNGKDSMSMTIAGHTLRFQSAFAVVSGEPWSPSGTNLCCRWLEQLPDTSNSCVISFSKINSKNGDDNSRKKRTLMCYDYA